MSKPSVIIAGGGPCGAAMALELALQGVRVVVLEKHEKPLLSPRAQSLSPRSMEFFMRWGIADSLRSRQLLPADFPHQGVWCASLVGDVYSVGGSNQHMSDDISSQKAIRIPLWITEDVLRHRLADFDCVTFLTQREVKAIEITEQGPSVGVHNRQLHTDESYSADYVVACDGANSVVRQALGIEFKPLASGRKVLNLLFDAPELLEKITVDKGFLYYLLGSVMTCVMGVVDPQRGLWYAQVVYTGDEASADDIDARALLRQVTGLNFDMEIIDQHFWNMQVQLAEHYSAERRVFLVGDSAHAFAPTGGFGLNTGLGDVVNLAWKLAAVIKGAHQPELLDSYEDERRPIAVNNLEAAERNARDMIELRKLWDPQIHPAEFAKENLRIAGQHMHSLGLTMGYAYGIDQKEAMAPSQYVPMIKPGYFLPHDRIANGDALYQHLSVVDWSLLVCGAGDEQGIEQFQQQALDKGVVVEHVVLTVGDYPRRYILIRPDWHIASVSDELPDLACIFS